MIREPITFWYADCEDSDRWTGPFDTYDEAVEECRDSLGDGWVASGRRGLFGAADLVPDADDQADQWAETCELTGQEGQTPFDDWTPAQFASLTRYLRFAAQEWMEAAGVNPRPALMFLEMNPPTRVSQMSDEEDAP